MELLLATLLAPLVDPAPGILRTKRALRRLECEHLDPGTASRRYPGRVLPERPRGDFVERSVMVCRQRLLAPGTRPDREEAILADLDVRADAMATAAASVRPELAERTWLVEAFYPDARVVGKLSFAAKNALMEQGLAVTDRHPRLAVGDVDVLTRMPPGEAYPAACARYHATGSVGAGDALLAVVSRDRRETQLHAGICADGRWEWLQ
ncbi:MAG: hypothetical protein H6736_18805 [Alphaproteobacteria bacterium]|nr:hypothetical protein [Alphaproteobacteria bacterium]